MESRPMAAMQLTKDNLEFSSRFDSAEMQKDMQWLRLLYEQSMNEGTVRYVVINYVFEKMAFVRSSISIFTAEMFLREYVMINPNQPGFSQIVRREDYNR